MSGEEVTELAGRLPLAGDGVHWSLGAGDDLNANLVHLDGRHEVGEHVNDAVDVLVVALDGDGDVVVDGRSHDLRPSVVALVPRGAVRTIRAGAAGLTYLTVHRRRSGPTIARRPGGT